MGNIFSNIPHYACKQAIYVLNTTVTPRELTPNGIVWLQNFFYRQLDFSSQPEVANEILEISLKVA